MSVHRVIEAVAIVSICTFVLVKQVKFFWGAGERERAPSDRGRCECSRAWPRRLLPLPFSVNICTFVLVKQVKQVNWGAWPSLLLHPLPFGPRPGCPHCVRICTFLFTSKASKLSPLLASLHACTHRRHARIERSCQAVCMQYLVGFVACMHA